MKNGFEEQCKNIERGIISANSQAYNTLKALTKTQQHAVTMIFRKGLQAWSP